MADVEFKKCERCGTVIGNNVDTDWYRYIRVQYCRDCAKIKRRENVAKANQRYRQKHRVMRDAGNECFDKLRAYTTVREQYIRMLDDKIEETKRKMESLSIPFFEEDFKL